MFNSFTNSPPMLYVDNMLSYLFDDLNPSFKQQEAPSYSSISYYHMPSPLIYNEIDINNLGDLFGTNDFALHQQPLIPNDSIITDDSSIFEVNTTNTEPKNKVDDTVNGAVEDANMSANRRPCTVSPVSRKRRSSKKDRHSKIRTAHGLRDRRMRLSLDVARPFFKLQDILGYDKASRTVEWLLIQSKPAIEELLQTKNNIESPSVLTVTKCTMSLNSDGEVESTIVEDSKGPTKSKGKKATTSSATKDNIKVKEFRKRTTKESRDNARERARKRTLERLHARGLEDDEQNFEVSPCWGALKIMEGCYGSSFLGKLSTLTSCNNQQNGEH